MSALSYIFAVIICLVAFVSSPALSEEITPIKHKPTIVALAPHIVEMLYSIGAGEQIIGASEYSDFPEQAKAIPRVNNYAKVQLERVIELQPDLIIAWQSGSPSDDIARLQQLGFTIVYSEPKTFEDIAKEIRLFGKLTGHTQQAKTRSDEFLSKLALIKATYQSSEPITVFYESWSRPLTTIANASWPQQHLNLCKANNPFAQNASPYPQVNIEQILQWPPMLIIQPKSAHSKNKEVFNWQDWPNIAAVKHQQLIQPNADALHRMTLRSLDELDRLCLSIEQTRKFYRHHK